MNDLELRVEKFLTLGMERALHSPRRDSLELVSTFRKPFTELRGALHFQNVIRQLSRNDYKAIESKLEAQTPAIPIQVIWGKHDQYLGNDIANGISKLLNAPPYTQLTSSAHFPQLDEPSEVAQLLEAYFETC